MPKQNIHSSPADTTHAVSAFMANLSHPHKQEIETIRQLILNAHPSIAEGIKWNAPSFRTTEYFATFNLRAKIGVAVILHLGAKSQPSLEGFAIADPSAIIKWLAKDRAIVEFTNTTDLTKKKAAFSEIIRQWIRHIDFA